MDIEKLVERKIALEKELQQALYESVRKFKAETGYSPSDISILLLDVSDFGSRTRQYMVGSVEVTLDLQGVLM